MPINNDGDSDGGSHRDESPERQNSETSADVKFPLIDTVLRYMRYGMSCATPDNLTRILCSHFSAEEICDAKQLLWTYCNLQDVPNRTNSTRRSAHQANVDDLLKAMYELDQDDLMPRLYVHPAGIGRLPRFNPESLNVVAMDQRVHELNEKCEVLQTQVDNYRARSLQYNDKLDHVMTVLQQHTNALRELKEQPSSARPPIFSDGLPTWKPVHTPGKSGDSTSGVHFNSFKVPDSLSKTLSASSSPSSLKTSQPPAASPIVSTPDQLQASSNLGGALASATGVNNKLLTSYSSVTSQNCKPTTTSSGSDRPPFSDGVRYRQMDRQEDNRQFCAFDGKQEMQPDGDATDHDGEFEEPRGQSRRREKKEQRRKKIIYGAADLIGCHIRGGTQFNKCDLFVSRVHDKVSVSDLKKHLTSRGFEISNMRIDVTSHKDAVNKSFRVIAPDNMKELLLCSVWPIGIRVQEYGHRKNRAKNNSRWR